MTEYTDGTPSYTDNSPFVRVLRNESHVRVLDAMLANPEEKRTVSRLMELTGMARSTVLRALDTLEDMDLVKQPDSVGGVNLYQPTDHSAMKHLHGAQTALLTDEGSRGGSPPPRQHDDQESIFGESFGEPPELGAVSEDIDVDLTS
jgi:hypothetical protein